MSPPGIKGAWSTTLPEPSPHGFNTHARYDENGRLRWLQHVSPDELLQEFSFNVDKRGNRTLVREAKTQGGGSNLVIPADDARVNFYKGEWNTVGNLRTSDTLTAALAIAFFGKDITIELETGADCGICDVYLDQNLWGSVETYAATAGTISINISAYQLGAHVLDIHNRRAKHPASTGHKLSFKQAEIVGSFYQHTLQHSYDTASRLTQTAYRSGIATTGTPFREYDFTYDTAGNRTNQTVKLNGVTASNINYGYNLADQLTSDGVNTYGYDARGNLSTINGSPAYTWDRANRLLSYGGSSYSYNGLGQRVSQTIGTNVTEYLQDVQPALYKLLSATTGADTTRYVHDPLGIHSQENPDGSWNHMMLDGLSSVRGLIDASANILGTRQYDPYGVVWDTIGSFDTLFDYTGQLKDSNGLLHLRARDYDPLLGVFTKLDPLELFNRYSYVMGNPTNRLDPSGLVATSPICTPNLKPHTSRLGFPVLQTDDFSIHRASTPLSGNNPRYGQLKVSGTGNSGRGVLSTRLLAGDPIDIYLPSHMTTSETIITPGVHPIQNEGGWQSVWRSRNFAIRYGTFINNDDFIKRKIGSRGVWQPLLGVADSWMPAKLEANQGDSACALYWDTTVNLSFAYSMISGTTAFGPDSANLYPAISSRFPNTAIQPDSNPSSNPTFEEPGNEIYDKNYSSSIQGVASVLFTLFYDVSAVVTHELLIRKSFNGDWGNYDAFIYADIQERVVNKAFNPEYRAIIYSFHFVTHLDETYSTRYDFIPSYVTAFGLYGSREDLSSIGYFNGNIGLSESGVIACLP